MNPSHASSSATSETASAHEISFSGRGILLDIEGTVAPIRYVYDVLFPFSRKHLADYLSRNWDTAEVARAKELIAKDAGSTSFADWCGGDVTQATAHGKLCAHLQKLMDADIKATGLKELQGLIWREGFLSGELKSELFDDVPRTLHAWADAGKDLRIFSSGSVAAQKLFFAHTLHGDLTPLLSGFYDTTTGPKREAASYIAIAGLFSLPTSDILFCSDIVAELDAARTAGMQTALAMRPGNPPVAAGHGHPEIASFRQIAAA